MVVLGVLNGGVIRDELGKEVVIGDGGVVRRDVVALGAKRAALDLGGKVNDGKGVEDGATCAAAERGVREEGDVRERSDRRVDGGDWDDAVGGFLLRAWDHVPWHSDSVLGF